MRTPPLLADFSHARPCKPFCENSLTLPTTFEALFMQNAKQIIAQKVMKTASKHQFRGGFWSEWGDSNSRHLAPKASALPTALHPDIQLTA